MLAFEGKLPEIVVSYFLESDGVDVINAYQDWAKRCPQGNAGTSDLNEKVTIIDGPDTKPDPSVTIRITTDHPPLDKTAPATTTILCVTRVRGVAVIAEIQNSDEFSRLAPVLQSSLRKLRAA